MREKELMIFRSLKEEPLLAGMAAIMTQAGESGWESVRSQEAWQCAGELLELASIHGFCGNVWHCFLSNLLVNDENVYSCSCEIVGESEGSLNGAVLHDMEIVREFLQYDFTGMKEILGVREWELVENFVQKAHGKVYNQRISRRISRLALQLAGDKSAKELKRTLTEFYREYGVGRFGLHKAFRVTRRGEETVICPILNIAHVKLDDLVGYGAKGSPSHRPSLPIT